MPDKPETLVYGLYEAYGAQCNEALSNNRIFHHLFVERDDDAAMAEAIAKSDGMIDVKVTRIMDVQARPR